MNSLPRLLLLAAACCLLAGRTVRAAERDMDLPGNWFGDRVEWRSSLGLPVDTEFVAPLCAQYNWAYGNTVLGINVRRFGTREYFTAIASYSDERLDILESEGPLQDASQLRSGRYHVTAGLANGSILCWLTAPGEYPLRLPLTDRYLRGSGFDVIVEAPDPPGNNWEAWTILLCYQTSRVGNDIVTEAYDGTGRLLYDLPGLRIDGLVREVEYTRHPTPGTDLPWLLISVDYGAVDAGVPDSVAVGTAWYVPDDQWYTQGVRNTSRDNSSIYLDEDAAAGGLAMMAWDDSDEYGVGGFIERLHLRQGNARQIITDKGLPNLINSYTSRRNWCFAKTAANRFPYIVFSNGTDIMFGYNAARRGSAGSDVGYHTFTLQHGEVITDDYGNAGALYPVSGLALSTHWNTGQPHVFYIRNGSADYEGGQLYQLQYTSPQASGD